MELAGGTTVPCNALFVHPPQKQIELVHQMDVELDDAGFVPVDATTGETSLSGIYAAGDLTTPMQGAILAAAAGTRAAGMLNHELTTELAVTGAL